MVLVVTHLAGANPVADLEKGATEGNLALVKQAFSDSTVTVPVDTTFKYGRTALMIAANRGHADVVAYLLDQGANIEHTDRNGDTALLLATYHPKVVQLLIERGANINHQNNAGITTLMNAASFGKVPTVKLLLKAGADTELKGKAGETALMFAELQQRGEIIRMLKAEQKKKTSLTTPSVDMWQAVKANNIKLVKSVLEKGYDTNKPNAQGETLLMVAAQTGNTGMIKLLLENGADPSLKNKEGHTAYDLAQTAGHEDVLPLLEINQDAPAEEASPPAEETSAEETQAPAGK